MSEHRPTEPSDKPEEGTQPDRAVKSKDKKRRPRGFLFVAILLGILLIIAGFNDPGAYSSSTVERNRETVVEWILAGRIVPESMELIKDTSTFRGKLEDPYEEKTRVEVKFGTREQVNEFYNDSIKKFNEGKLVNERIEWTVRPSRTLVWQFVMAVLPWALFLVILYFLFFRQLRSPGGPGGNILSFGKSRAKLASQEATGVTFADVAGVEEAKQEVTEIVQFLKYPQKFTRLGGRIPRGVMLVGPPGTGKTLLAKAIAGEAGVPFFSICGSDFVEMFVGVGAARVRDLFKQARESSPCIIFLDEVDAVGRRRGSGLGGGHDEREQTLNAILVEMDGFDSDSGIIFIAATNRPDVLDPALLRPGRFDRQIMIDLPDLRGREQILAVHAANVKLDPAASLERVARGTPSFSGAELAALMNEGAIIAAMKDQERVLEGDLEEARDKIRYGLQKTSRVMVHEDRLITAYHEAGHALVAHLLPEVEPLHKVSIVPRGLALGMTMQLPERDRYHMSRKQVLGNLKLLYGGRIAEEMFCGDVTSGASNDIERATDLAHRMVCEWGMSDSIGPIKYTENEQTLFLGREVTRSRDHSEALALRIDDEIHKIVEAEYQSAERIIEEHRDAIERIAVALMERETLTGDEVAVLVQGGDLQPFEREPSAVDSKSKSTVADLNHAKSADEAGELTGDASGMNPDVLPAS